MAYENYKNIKNEVESTIDKSKSDLENLELIEEMIHNIGKIEACKIIQSPNFPDHIRLKPEDMITRKEINTKRKPYKTKYVLQEIIYEALYDDCIKN